MSTKKIGICGVVGVVAGFTLVGAAACGSGFSADDCKANRTCTESGGQDSADGGAGATTGGTAVGGAGQSGAGATDATDTGGAGGSRATELGGAGGVPDTGCHAAADCSNDDPVDGEEICDPSGACLPGNPPPTVVSVAPEDGAVAVEPDGTVVIEFSEALDPKSVTKTTIELLDSDTPVAGTPAYADKKVTFTPTAPLALLGDYTVNVTTDVTDADGAHLLEAFSSMFSTRDGTWHTPIDPVNDPPSILSDALPISSSGEVLLAWCGNQGHYGPGGGRVFLRGANVTPATAFTRGISSDDCNEVSSGGNDAGIGAVAWNVPDGTDGNSVEQFRAGAWQATAPIVSHDYNAFRLTLAVAPTGIVTLFQHSPGVGSTAWRTDANGAWPAEGDPISTREAESRASAAFDAQGNGLAVWAAKDPNTGFERIVASRYTASGKWATAIDLPGSVAAFTTADIQRGAPALAFEPNGDALALWVKATVLMANHFTKGTWSDAEAVSGALTVNALQNPPGLVFDGQAFVAAWTAKNSKQYTYSARYDLKTGWSAPEQRQSTPADGTSFVRMPGLASDGRGNSMLVWATGAAPNFTLVYQRYAAGAWNGIQPLPGGSVTSEGLDLTSLSSNAGGLAAIAWANRAVSGPNLGAITTVRLANFY